MSGSTQIRAAATMAIAVLAWAASTQWAAAQTRTFSCGRHKPVTITVTSPDTISAGPIEGRTMQMKKNPKDPLNYFSGDYGVQVSPDQARVIVQLPDGGGYNCSFASQAAAPTAPPPAQTPPPSADAGQDPCAPGYRQAPETDRCDPIPEEAGREARAAGLAGVFPAEAQSLGGIVRTGPSRRMPKAASLAEGAPVEILERAVTLDEGYSWFKIRFNGRTGYQWGGIMCSRNPLSGILKQCDQP